MSEHLSAQRSGDERALIARRYTESAEDWLRRLVHAELEISGPNYITTGDWSKSLTSYVKNKYRENPNKYSREVDATTFDQLIDMVCHPKHWKKWSSGLREAYPNGVEEARTFLNRIKDIRNDLSHGQVCSKRQLERAICYANDLSDSIKTHFRGKGLSSDFDVPSFIRVYDDLGNSGHLRPDDLYKMSDFSGPERRMLYPGDILVAEVEVDPSFDATGYDVEWWMKFPTGGWTSGSKAVIHIEKKHIGARMEIQFRLKTHRDWHRNGDHDDSLELYYKVLPPPR